MNHCRLTAPATLAVALAVFFPSFTAPAAETSGGGSVELRPRWRARDVREFDFTKATDRTENGRVQVGEKRTSRVRLTVIEATPKGYVVEWRVTKVPSLPAGGVAEEASLQLATLPVVIELDSAVNVIAIRNLAQVRAAYEKWTVDVMRNASPYERAASANLIRTMFADQASAKLLLKDFTLLLAPLGHELQPGRPTRVGEAVMSLVSHDAEAGTATVASEMSFDPAAAPPFRNQLAGMFSQQAGRGDDAAALEKFVRETKFDVEDRAEHVVEASTGWPTKVRYRRIIRGGGRQRMDATWVVAVPTGGGR